MKLQVTQENLNSALMSVAKVASSRSTLPILSNILLKTKGTRLSVAATNLDIAITHYIGSKVSEEGSITIPARLMQEFVSSLPSGVIDIELDDTKLHITTPQYTSTINGAPADDFPVMPAITSGKSLELPGPIFKKALQQVIFAASGDDSRPVLTGVYIYTQNNSLYAVATDSYRLAEEVMGTHKEEITLLIPATALAELLRLIGDDDSKIKVTYDDQQASFSVDDTELVTRLIDGKYPDYQKLIPKDFAIVATVNRNEMINITKVSSLFARSSSGSIKLEINEEDQLLSIHSIASQLGENTSSSAAKIKGSGSITINSRYLLDALHALGGDDVEFCCNGKLEPALIKDPSNKNYTHIIMPLKS